MLQGVEQLAGFHPPEQDELGPFVWTEGAFQMRLCRPARFARLTLCYYGDQGVMSVASASRPLDQVPLCRGWHTCAVAFGDPSAGDVLDWRVAPVVPVAGDPRQLGLMLRELRLFDDEGSFGLLSQAQRNLCQNKREYQQGLAVLASSPPALRVNLEVRCNIPETSQACAYCAWDWAKEAERGSPPFTLATLDELGDTYRQAIEVNDCGIGEPTMNKAFGPIVARIDGDGKRISLTTNGQLLSPGRRREIVGKNLHLYVSIDSATAAGYARYRNHRFDDVIANLKALCQEKKAHGDLPRVYASFIAMRSNVNELPRFFALMRDVGVDEIKIRALYLDDNLPSVTINNGYRFDYAAEVLTMDELARIGAAARALAREHGVGVYVESEQFAQDVAQPGAPPCDEPWRTMYVLRRGIMPCSYATEPIARWDEQQGRPLAEFLRDVFNGAAYQEIRAQLAAGQLAEYCRNTPSCPILKSKQQRGLVVPSPNRYQKSAMAGPHAAGEATLPLVPLDSLKPENRAA